MYALRGFARETFLADPALVSALLITWCVHSIMSCFVLDTATGSWVDDLETGGANIECEHVYAGPVSWVPNYKHWL